MAILTLSREFGSGGVELGRAVAESLSYGYMDKESILRGIRSSGHEWEVRAKELYEHSPTVWERYDWSFRGLGALVQSTILNRALEDNVVIIGRGGNLLLEGIPHALRAHMVAPIEARTARIMENHSVSEEAARLLIKKMDREIAGFVYSLYGKLWNDPSQFDLIFNTGSQAPHEILATLKSLLAEKDAFMTHESRSILEMRSAAANIKAGLLTNASLSFITTLDVEYDGRSILLRGIVHNPKEHRSIEEEAGRLAGGRPLRCELHYRG